VSGRRLLALVPVLLWLAWPRAGAAAPVVVNDVTRLNPVAVERVVVPKTVDEVRDLVRHHSGAISIGGARHSMGGQIATEGSLHLDMRGLHRIVAFSPEKRRITVEAGITWRKIQEAIDPHGLSVSIMQSYANFTVGGSLSVNVHGRYVGQGPLIAAVQSIEVVLADGQLVQASRSVNPELFFGSIGGYGGLGVIVEATLDLAENGKVAREVRKLPVAEYREHFLREVRDSPRAVFHNGDLYPPAYDTVMAVTWSETDRPVTVPDRLMPLGGHHWKDRVMQFGISELPFGKELRADVLDPLRLRDSPVVWRNYEASYDAAEIEPASRARSTYVLAEYFVPVARFDDFVPRMTSIFRRHRVNVLNVSIRHARQDPGSLLAWAREESFAFVVYYKQGVTQAARQEVGDWTRELIDAALAAGGSYYLPYQLHATDEQFHRAYPRAGEFFALKRRLDPDYRFRNKLWDRYFPPSVAQAAAPGERSPAARSEAQTFLTLPEWYIVYSADEYAAFLERQRPTDFPFFRSVGQFWHVHASVVRATWGRYPFNWGYHAMIGVIGASYSVEYVLRGVYENSVGLLTDWLAEGTPETEEDRFMAQVAAEYARFIHATPWHEFPFGEKLVPLWELQDGAGTSALRAWERRLAFTVELTVKSAWGWAMRKATHAAYDPEDLVIQARARALPKAGLPRDPRVRVLGQPDGDGLLLSLPRYEPFTETVRSLARQGVQFLDIAGNRTIVMTLIAPRRWRGVEEGASLVSEWDILTRPEEKRVAIEVPVERLHEMIPRLERARVKIDHVYDY